MIAQPTRERHRFVVPLRTEKPIDVGAVLGKVGRTELPTAGELEDDRDQLDATVNADAQFFRLRRYLRQRKDKQEGESSRAKRHDHPSPVCSVDSTRRLIEDQASLRVLYLELRTHHKARLSGPT